MAKKERKTQTKTEKAKSLSQSPAQPSILRKIYERLPLLPFLDRQTSAIAYACILGYFLFMLYFFIAGPRPEFTNAVIESPIAKNSQLMLIAGEAYTYEVSGPLVEGFSQQVQYDAKSSLDCSGLLVVERISGKATSSECLSKSTGNAVGDPLQLNSSTGNQTFLLFSPWMLAVSDSFNWQSTSIVSAGGLEINFKTTLKSLGTKQVAGRQAYEISASSSAIGSQSKFFVDAEKRVLLSADSGNLTIRLVSAPFALNWTNKN